MVPLSCMICVCEGAFTPDANEANTLFACSWTLEHFEFTRFIRVSNLLHSHVKITSQQARIRALVSPQSARLSLT